MYKNSKKKHSSAVVLFYNKSNKREVGFTASKKIGNAIKRNFAKRRMRSVFSLFDDKLLNGSFILVAKHDILNIKFDKLKKEILYTLKRLDAIK